MKLYTEEQVKKIAQQVKQNGYWSNLEIEPIKLPTDEEIERELESHEHMTLELEAGFKAGAKYVIYKIQGGNNEPK